MKRMPTKEEIDALRDMADMIEQYGVDVVERLLGCLFMDDLRRALGVA